MGVPPPPPGKAFKRFNIIFCWYSQISIAPSDLVLSWTLFSNRLFMLEQRKSGRSLKTKTDNSSWLYTRSYYYNLEVKLNLGICTCLLPYKFAYPLRDDTKNGERSGESPKKRQPIKSLGVIWYQLSYLSSDLWVNILQSGHSIAEWYPIIFAYWRPNEVHKQRQFVNLSVRRGFAKLHER